MKRFNSIQAFALSVLISIPVFFGGQQWVNSSPNSVVINKSSLERGFFGRLNKEQTKDVVSSLNNYWIKQYDPDFTGEDITNLFRSGINPETANRFLNYHITLSENPSSQEIIELIRSGITQEDFEDYTSKIGRGSARNLGYRGITKLMNNDLDPNYVSEISSYASSYDLSVSAELLIDFARNEYTIDKVRKAVEDSAEALEVDKIRTGLFSQNPPK